MHILNEIGTTQYGCLKSEEIPIALLHFINLADLDIEFSETDISNLSCVMKFEEEQAVLEEFEFIAYSMLEEILKMFES